MKTRKIHWNNKKIDKGFTRYFLSIWTKGLSSARWLQAQPQQADICFHKTPFGGIFTRISIKSICCRFLVERSSRVFGRNSQAPLSSAAAARLAYVHRLTHASEVGRLQKQGVLGKVGRAAKVSSKKMNFRWLKRESNIAVQLYFFCGEGTTGGRVSRTAPESREGRVVLLMQPAPAAAFRTSEIIGNFQLVVQYPRLVLVIRGNWIFLSVLQKASPHFSFGEKCLCQQISSQNLQRQMAEKVRNKRLPKNKNCHWKP